MKHPRLLGIGGAHVDRRGTMTADYIRGASIPGTMIEELGGGVFNALRVAVQFATAASLLSVRGGDAAAYNVAAEIKRSGIEDLSSVFLDRATASYTALLDNGGDVVAALADMDIYEKALPRQISRRKTRDAIKACDAILIDANMPQEAIIRLMRFTDDKPVYALAISPAKAGRLTPVLAQLQGIFLNKREARALLGLEQADTATSKALCEGLQQFKLKTALLTDGAGEIAVLDNNLITSLKPPRPANVVDVTGAGDALAGATLAAILQGKPWKEAAACGAAAAAQTVETSAAVADFRSKARFQALFDQIAQSQPDN